MQEIKILAGLPFVHTALFAVRVGAHSHAGTNRVIRVRKASVSQSLNVVTQVQFVSTDCFVNLRRQRSAQGMLEVNAATGTLRILLKVLLDSCQIIALASAVRVVAHYDSFQPRNVIKSSQCFVHPDFPRQPDAGMFRRQFRKVQQADRQPRVPMLRNPFSGRLQSRLIL